MRESTKYGILLHLMQNPELYELSEFQRLWIVYRSRKLSEAELLRSGIISENLNSDGILRQRMKHQIRLLHIRVPSLNPINLPEKRRIGIGYRDKGALRPLHEDRKIGEPAYWSEDIQCILPLTNEEDGRWITADEVTELVGRDRLILSLLSINQNHSISISDYLTELFRSD